MFIGLSKTIGKVGGFRIGIGKRITTKNAWWLVFALFFYAMYKMTVCMLVVSFWLVYAMLYGMWWCIKKIFQGISKLINKGKSNYNSSSNSYEQVYQSGSSNTDNNTPDDIPQVKPGESIWYCSKCGMQNSSSQNICSKCGNII